MTQSDQDELRSELADVDEALRRLRGEAGDLVPDAARDTGDEGLELTERMEVEAQVEALSRRRERILQQLGE
jgi:hypothetical protein